MYDNKLYTIKTLSNLHVGGGDANYSVVDKQIQRDSITAYPTIHASSFKGAMREYAKHTAVSEQNLTLEGKVADETVLAGNGMIYTVFGQEPKGNGSEMLKAKAGHMIFSEPKLLSLPVRTDKTPFLHAICPNLIAEYNAICEIYGLTDKIPEFDDTDIGYYCKKDFDGELTAEEYNFKFNKNDKLSILEKYIGDNVILLSNEQFKKISKTLPVIARNYLENGESKNLFYEEIVPKESMFYVVLRYPNDNLLSMDARDMKSKKHLIKFQQSIQNMHFYLGANTSIGYGLCELKQIFPQIQEKSDG